MDEWEGMTDDEEEDLPTFTWFLFECFAIVFLFCWEFVVLAFALALAIIGAIFNTDSIVWLLEYVVF